MVSCEIHGFSDSSQIGYGEVVYLRISTASDIRVFFICAKSRVFPTKRVSLPRLELCAAVLLADIIKYVKELYFHLLNITNTFAWSDSTVALSWIRAPSSQWKTFVANRVSHIQDAAPNTEWRHVPTSENPADTASRGQFPADLVHSTLWWAGPQWLAQSSAAWPQLDLTSTHDNTDDRGKSTFFYCPR
ncbi:uncharacterized protein LOC113231629 [Hyposmocoma kahamanoa]|uniref:uncharacterized protein LOC113231629 n=1 Tax=Hyposmocoma kahamanoa TaxID=1477025 RepID=UPI000E6D749E|nr:uncharacterized protein LOC113231629 [Hyposmocoma kahamanoa]